MSKKILSLLLISALMVSAGTVTKKFTFPEPVRVKDGYTYLEGCRPGMQGFAPAVSVKGVKLLLPVGQQAKSATVQYGKLLKVKSNVFIEPNIPAYKSKNASLKLGRKNIYKDAAARSLLARYYEKDALYPGTSQETVAWTQHKYGFPIGMTVVNPVQYNPVRGELYYYEDVTVSIETEAINPSFEVTKPVLTRFHRSMLEIVVDNPEALGNLELTPRGKNDYEVLVITYSTLKDKFNDYVALNKRRGLRTKVVMASDAIAGGTGSDDQKKMRSYVKKQFEEKKIVFCVLGGDINRVKHRELYSESYDHNQTPDRRLRKYSGADLYYGTLDGTWNNNNNGRFGEPGEEDLLWEVYVSRMPADNTTHLDNMLKKTKHYAETPKKNQVKNILMAGEFLWDDYGKTIWGIDNMEYYIGHKNKYGWETWGWPTNFNIARISDKQTGAAHGWRGSDLRNRILNHKPAWIDHDGHANTTYCYTFNSSSIRSYFTNTGSDQNYWISVSGGCNPGQFKVSDCFMEVAVQHDKGAVAVCGNWDSGIGDDDDNNSPSGVPTRHMHDAIFNKKKRVHFLEATHAMGKEAIVDVSTNANAINIRPYYGLMRYVSYNTNSFGDPALSIWTDTPKDLTNTSFQVTANKEKFEIKNCPPYTCVLLVNPSNDEVISQQITGYKFTGDQSFVVGDSACVINDADYKAFAASNGKVKAYIKATNYIPGSIEVDIGGTNINKPMATGFLTSFEAKSLGKNTMIQFALRDAGLVKIELYNVQGVLVKTLLNKTVAAGSNLLSINNNELNNGLYCCKISTNNVQDVKSFVVAK